MNKLFLLIILSFFSFSSYSQVYKKICVQFGEVSCVEYATTGLLQISDLTPWFFDDDSAYRVPFRGTKIENESQEVENPFKEKIESDFSMYGEGIATAMASIAKRFNELEVQNESVEDNLTSIRGRVDQVINKDNEISSKYQNSIPELHKKISDLNKELESSLNDEKNSLEEENDKVSEEIENNPVSEEGKLDNAPIQRMEFEAKDKLLQEKREKLFNDHDPSLSKDTVQNIYETSGRLQTESRSYYASDDYESAFFGQELAMGLVDFGLGLTPVVGDGIALYEAFIGESPVTGQKLSGAERILSATTGVIGLVSFGTLGALTRGLSKSGRLFSFSEKVGGIFQGARKLLKSTLEARPVKIPWGSGFAKQELSLSAIKARGKVEGGGVLYRIGTKGSSQTGMKAQFWALEHPKTLGYADKYGIPPQNMEKFDFVEIAKLKEGENFITRKAPGVGSSRGGGIEIVVPENSVIIEAHTTLD